MSRQLIMKHVKLIGQGADWPEVLNSFVNDPAVPEKVRMKAVGYRDSGMDPKAIMTAAARSAPAGPVEGLEPANTQQGGGNMEGLLNSLPQTAKDVAMTAAPIVAGMAAGPFGMLAASAAPAGVAQLQRMGARYQEGQPVMSGWDIPHMAADVGLNYGLGQLGAKGVQQAAQSFLPTAQQTMRGLAVGGGQAVGAPVIQKAFQGGDLGQMVADPMNLFSALLGGSMSARSGGTARSVDPDVPVSPMEATINKLTNDPLVAREASNFLKAVEGMGQEAMGRDVLGNPDLQPTLQKMFSSISEPAQKVITDAISQQQGALPPTERFASPIEATTDLAKFIEPSVRATEMTQALPSAEVSAMMAPDQPAAIQGAEQLGAMRQSATDASKAWQNAVTPENLAPLYKQIGQRATQDIPQQVGLEAKAASKAYGDTSKAIKQRLGGTTVEFSPNELPAPREAFNVIRSTPVDPRVLKRLEAFLAPNVQTTGGTILDAQGNPINPPTTTVTPKKVSFADLQDFYQALNDAGKGMERGSNPLRQINQLKSVVNDKVAGLNDPAVTQAWDQMNAEYSAAKGEIGDIKQAAGRNVMKPNKLYGNVKVGQDLVEGGPMKNELLADPRFAPLAEDVESVRQMKQTSEQQAQMATQEAGDIGQTLGTVSQPPSVTTADPTAPGTLVKAVQHLQTLGKQGNLDPKLATALSKSLLTRGVLEPSSTELPLSKTKVIDSGLVSQVADKGLIKALNTVGGPDFWNKLKSLWSVPKESVSALRSLLEMSKSTGKPQAVIDWLTNNVARLAETGPADLDRLAGIYDSYTQGVKGTNVKAPMPKTSFYNTLAEIINNALVADDFSKAPDVWTQLDPRFKQAVYGKNFAMMDEVVNNLLPKLTTVRQKLSRSPSSNISNERSMWSNANYMVRFFGPSMVASALGLPISQAATIGVPIVYAMLKVRPAAILNKFMQAGIKSEQATPMAANAAESTLGERDKDGRNR